MAEFDKAIKKSDFLKMGVTKTQIKGIFPFKFAFIIRFKFKIWNE